jgi:hypothetical protein
MLYLDQQQVRDREFVKDQMERLKEPILLPELKTFSEEDYWSLPDVDRDFFDNAIAKYKKQRNVVAERKRQDRQPTETKGEDATKKADEEKGRKQKGGKDKVKAKAKGGKAEDGKAGRKAAADKHDDDVSRTDGEDALQFLNDTTAYQYEKFVNGLDALLSVFKETDRSNAQTAHNRHTTTDKKAAKQKAAAAAAGCIASAPETCTRVVTWASAAAPAAAEPTRCATGAGAAAPTVSPATATACPGYACLATMGDATDHLGSAAALLLADGLLRWLTTAALDRASSLMRPTAEG